MLLTRVTYWYTYRSSKTYRPSYLDYLHINFLKANQSSFLVILQPPTCKLFLELSLISHNKNEDLAYIVFHCFHPYAHFSHYPTKEERVLLKDLAARD